jgi:RNA polymerase sigma factor (sigma-70 family)
MVILPAFFNAISGAEDYSTSDIFLSEIQKFKEKEMKKVFLVRKDTTLPYGEGNWQIMNVAEFKTFKQTEQAKNRKFVRLLSGDNLNNLVIKECEEEEARQIDALNKRNLYNYNYAKQKQIIEVPYSLVNVDGELISSEQLIPDERENVEEIVEKKIMSEQLHKALSQLTNEERQIIYALYFSDKKSSLQEVANIFGIAKSTLQYKVEKILAKLRKLLQ